MKAALSKAIELLETHTGTLFDIWDVSGPRDRKIRQMLMQTLVGKRVPVAKCGVNALRAEFYRQAGIVGTCPADRRAKFAEFCKLARWQTMTADQLLDRIEREKSKHKQHRPLSPTEREALADARRKALAEMNQARRDTPAGQEAYKRFRRVARAMDLH